MTFSLMFGYFPIHYLVTLSDLITNWIIVKNSIKRRLVKNLIDHCVCRPTSYPQFQVQKCKNIEHRHVVMGKRPGNKSNTMFGGVGVLTRLEIIAARRDYHQQTYMQKLPQITGK